MIVVPHRRKAFRGAGMPMSNADVFNFECDSLAGWTNNDVGNGVTALATEDTNDTIRQYDTAYGSNNLCRVFKDGLYSTPANSFVVSVRAKMTKATTWNDAGGTVTNSISTLRIDDDGSNYLFLGWRFYLDKIRALSGPNTYYDITTDITDWFWFTAKVTYTTSAVTTDIYLGNGSGTVWELVATGANQYARAAGVFDGYIRLDVIDRINEATRPSTFWDKIYVGSDFA